MISIIIVTCDHSCPHSCHHCGQGCNDGLAYRKWKPLDIWAPTPLVMQLLKDDTWYYISGKLCMVSLSQSVVSQAKLRYDPIELDPEEMCRMASEQPQVSIDLSPCGMTRKPSNGGACHYVTYDSGTIQLAPDLVDTPRSTGQGLMVIRVHNSRVFLVICL